MRQPSIQRTLLAVVLLVFSAAGGEAQLIRGTVRDAQSGREVSGALVTLLRADSSEIWSVLTDAGGRYSIRTPGPGSYRVTAKRIGAQRTVTAPIQLEAGEARLHDISLSAVHLTLPDVTVAAPLLCANSPADFSRVAALWEEVFTALSATAISERDSLYAVDLERYTRELDPRTLRVRNEVRERRNGVVSLPFSTVSPESLSTIGYWTEEGDTTTFYGVDVNVLLSDSFRRDHCFGLSRTSRDKPGQVGLSFEPARGRQVPDIRGTMWIDSTSFHLTSLDYSYTRLPRLENIERVGGQFRFAQIPGGAWIVQQWQIRMPQVVRYSERGSGRRSQGVAAQVRVISPPVVHRIIETGGEAQLASVSGETTAVLEGMIVDSIGRPMAFGSVRIAGTSLGTIADSIGAFTIPGVPAGNYEVYLSDSLSAALGIPLAVAPLTLSGSGSTNLRIQADNTVQLMARMCGGRTLAPETSVVRLSLADHLAGANATLRLTWTEYESVNGLPRVVMQRLESAIDRAGSTVFCGLPLHVPIDVELAIDEESGHHLTTIRNRISAPIRYRVGDNR